MRSAVRQELLDTGRSLVGGLILGLPLLYTMETWWLGWRLPLWMLALYALAGLFLVSIVVRYAGFRKEEEEEEESHRSTPIQMLRSSAALLMHSVSVAVVILTLFGIIDRSTPFDEVVRLVTIQIPPLALGGAIANHALAGGGDGERTTLTKESAIFVLGALFFALPISPTEEMELMAAHAGWWRIALVPIFALLLTYLTLYVLEFRGRESRGRMFSEPKYQVGEVFGAYVLSLLVSFAILAAYGHFVMGTVEEAVQKVVVMSFVASIGGAAARVVV